MTEVSHRLEESSGQATSKVSHIFRLILGLIEESCHTYRDRRLMMETLLTSSKGNLKMPERHWPELWASGIRQGFKVNSLDLIGRSCLALVLRVHIITYSGSRCPQYFPIYHFFFLSTHRYLFDLDNVSLSRTELKSDKVVLLYSISSSWSSNAWSISQLYHIIACFSLTPINPSFSSQLTPHHLEKPIKYSIIWTAGGLVSSLNCNSSPLP